MRYTVDLPAADWPTLPAPGELVAEVISGSHALPLTVVSAARVGALVRLELDAPSRTIGQFTGTPVEVQPGKRHNTEALATGSAFVCSSSLTELPPISGA